MKSSVNECRSKAGPGQTAILAGPCRPKSGVGQVADLAGLGLYLPGTQQARSATWPTPGMQPTGDYS